MDNTKKPLKKLEMGIQPLDQLIHIEKLAPFKIIEASPVQITFKNIKSARNGRFISRRVREKILTALKLATGKEYKLADLFNY
jgi:hypothetical protein